MRHKDEGYYGNLQPQENSQSDSQHRHKDDGYYSDVKSVPTYVPPVETKVVPVNLPPLITTPVVPIPAVTPSSATSSSERKFDDDTGSTGSITFTRHVNTAKEMLNTGHPDIAKRHFEDAIKMFPNQADLYEPLYESCVQMRDWNQACRTLEKLFELQPAKERELEWGYGQAQFELRNWGKAVPSLKKAAGYGHHQAECHKMLLKIAQQQNDSPSVIAEYAALLKLKNDYNTRVEFANYLDRVGKHPDAIGQYKLAVAIQSSDGPLMARIAYMLMFYNKDYSGAVQYYNKAIQIDPANAANYQQNIAYAQQQIDALTKPKKKSPVQ